MSGDAEDDTPSAEALRGTVRSMCQCRVGLQTAAKRCRGSEDILDTAANAREVKTRGQVRRRSLSKQASAEDEGGGGGRAGVVMMGNLQSHLRLLFLVFWSARLRRRPPLPLNSSPHFFPSLPASSRVRFAHRKIYNIVLCVSASLTPS